VPISRYLTDDFIQKREVLRKRKNTLNPADQQAMEDLEWGRISDPAWQEYYQEHAQLDAAAQRYVQLKNELRSISAQQNSAAFNDVIRRMEELFRANRQFDHFPPLLQLVHDLETAYLKETGRECTSRVAGESLLLSQDGPIKVKWPVQLIDPARACIDFAPDKRSLLIQYFRGLQQRLAGEGEAFSREVFQKTFESMVKSGQLPADIRDEIQESFTGVSSSGPTP
ncbi:MAG: hypothetical protein AB7J40_04095, partial [Candidatus Altimarinota bacterium]